MSETEKDILDNPVVEKLSPYLFYILAALVLLSSKGAEVLINFFDQQ